MNYFKSYQTTIALFLLSSLQIVSSSEINNMQPNLSQRFKQDAFAIGMHVDPPADEKMAQSYADIANANFNLVISGAGAINPLAVKKQIPLLEKNGLKGLICRVGYSIEKLPKSPVIWGYVLKDEPSAKDFQKLSVLVNKIAQVHPGYLAFINLLPDYATPNQLGCDSYEKYIEKFINEVNVPILCMDHYPSMTPKVDQRINFCKNLAVMRKYSLKTNRDFWNYFNVMPFGPHYDPTESQIRWQIYSSIAYGAKGILYFCYWTPRGKEFSKGGAIITADGKKTRHYEQAKRINHVIKLFGPTLMKLTSLGVYHVRSAKDFPQNAVFPIKNITVGDYLIGVFQHTDGRLAVLINNYSYNYTAWPTIEFKNSLTSIKEISRTTGKEIAIEDDSPDMAGLQISLDSGEGRLFLISQP